MASHEAARALRMLSRGFERLTRSDPVLQCLAPRFARSMATEAPLPPDSYHMHNPPALSPSSTMLDPPSTTSPPDDLSPDSPVLTTIYSWPTMEPMRFEQYSSKQLYLPLRRDILHRAVVYEGDMTRQGTASTKWRKDVHGTSKKVLPQKGTGNARVGDKKSPIRKGGGVAFGPHPRDFSTGLQRKVYDLAWRTALSYRYRRGELIVIGDKISIRGKAGIGFLTEVFQGNQWGSGFGRSTLVTSTYRPPLFKDMGELKRHGIVKDMFDVDVKDLLETGRIVMEKQALDTILRAHMSDLGAKNTMEHAAELVAREWKATRTAVDEEFDEVVQAAPDLHPRSPVRR